MRFKQVQARCGEVCHMSSMRLNHPELVHKHPAHFVSHRTYTNHIITEIARCVEVYHMSLGADIAKCVEFEAIA